MPAPEPASFFGFTVDTWFGLITALLAAFAVVVAAKQKRRRRAELGDGSEAEAKHETEHDHRRDPRGGIHPLR